MDNAYQQKLQERAWQLCKKWHGGIVGFYDKEKKIAAMESFLPLAVLTLEWSADDFTSGMLNGFMRGQINKEITESACIEQGFMPPKTDNNEG